MLELALTEELILALVGTRKRTEIINKDVTAFMASLDKQRTIIVTGDAGGVDAHVRRECDRVGIRYIECHVRKVEGQWAGIWAGPERNEVIARLAHRVIAWPLSSEESGTSAGTWNCIKQFASRNKPVSVRKWWEWKRVPGCTNA